MQGVYLFHQGHHCHKKPWIGMNESVPCGFLARIISAAMRDATVVKLEHMVKYIEILYIFTDKNTHCVIA